MRPQAPGQPRFAPVQRQVVAPQMAVLGAMRAGTVPAHNLVPAHPHEAQPQLSTSQPDVRLVPQPTAYSQTQQLQGQQVEVMLMPQAALQQHEPQPQQVPPGPQADVKLVPQPQLNHAQPQPQPAVQPQEPLPRNPSEQAEVRALTPPMQHVPTGQAEFRPMQPNPHEAQPQMPGPQAQQLLPQSSRFVQDSSQARGWIISKVQEGRYVPCAQTAKESATAVPELQLRSAVLADHVTLWSPDFRGPEAQKGWVNTYESFGGHDSLPLTGLRLQAGDPEAARDPESYGFCSKIFVRP